MRLKRPVARAVCAAAAVLAFAAPSHGTMWVPVQVECPLCGTVNTFNDIMSYGSYIYHWPSKYEYIYWPLIDENVLYTCKGCRLSCFMWDFEKVPAEKRAAIEKALAGTAFSAPLEPYDDIPMAERLEAAEKVYRVTGRDDEEWCQFYRVMGYWYAEAGDARKAAAAREKALAIAQKMLADGANDPIRKELFLISGSMRRLLGEEAEAISDFREASRLTFANEKVPAENRKAFDEYLSTLIGEHLEQLGAGPRLFAWLAGAAGAAVVGLGVVAFVLIRRRRDRAARREPEP